MNPIPFLYDAYIVAWMAEGGFILFALTRYRKADRELREFQKK